MQENNHKWTRSKLEKTHDVPVFQVAADRLEFMRFQGEKSAF